ADRRRRRRDADRPREPAEHAAQVRREDRRTAPLERPDADQVEGLAAALGLLRDVRVEAVRPALDAPAPDDDAVGDLGEAHRLVAAPDAAREGLRRLLDGHLLVG